MAGSDFERQMRGYGLSLVEIHYFLPDHPSLLQQFVLQQYDIAPRFPALRDYLDFWRRDIEAAIHSVRLSHQHLISPSEWRAIDGVISIH